MISYPAVAKLYKGKSVATHAVDSNKNSTHSDCTPKFQYSQLYAHRLFPGEQLSTMVPACALQQCMHCPVKG